MKIIKVAVYKKDVQEGERLKSTKYGTTDFSSLPKSYQLFEVPEKYVKKAKSPEELAVMAKKYGRQRIFWWLNDSSIPGGIRYVDEIFDDFT